MSTPQRKTSSWKSLFKTMAQQLAMVAVTSSVEILSRKLDENPDVPLRIFPPHSSGTDQVLTSAGSSSPIFEKQFPNR